MFASIRRYRLDGGSMKVLTRLVDDGFAPWIAKKTGFVSYEFVDCHEGEIMTLSIFHEAEQAAASRELAKRWTQENLRDFDFTIWEALHGEILVSRAERDMLEPGHVGAERKVARARRYALRGGSLAALMHKVDETFADRIQQLDGFEAYHACDCGGGQFLTISVFRDQTSATSSDDLALQFVGEELGEFDIERTEVFGGEVIISRAAAELLEPAHA
jgi:hypothetical protein